MLQFRCCSLFWKFPFSHANILPNYYSYVISTIVFLFYRPMRLIAVAAFGFYGLSSFSYWYCEGLGEFASFWCWLTVVNCIYPLVEPFVFRDLVLVKDYEAAAQLRKKED